MCGFSHFNPNLLNLFSVSNVFHDSTRDIYNVWDIFALMSSKFNKI